MRYNLSLLVRRDGARERRIARYILRTQGPVKFFTWLRMDYAFGGA